MRCRQGIRVGRDAESCGVIAKGMKKVCGFVWIIEKSEKGRMKGCRKIVVELQKRGRKCVANIVKMGRGQLHSPALTWCSAQRDTPITFC